MTRSTDLLMPGDPGIRRILTPKAEVYFWYEKSNHPLKYPLHRLQFSVPKKLLNVLIIGIDTWRYDGISKIYTPNIYEFPQGRLQFKNHWSGARGNCT
ncbi:hypothetical protein [Candidatus Coxiella mudrowiae]|uniref:hypothetical protein n=1 Tax=Candidatus Coxiella mudrowiae TaxID=2054173 RepID=UPI001FD02825|nr:hypothetical protein [Candidatus Coxiella mudrowiae]